MSSEKSENAAAPKSPALPAWIQAPLFEPVFKEIQPNFVKTKSFKAKSALSAGENYATIMLRVTAEVELKDGSSKTISLMLKICPDNPMLKDMMKRYNMFEVEAMMYNEIVPEFEEMYREVGMDIRFGAKAYKLKTDEPHILLEDLGTSGFKNANRLEGLDMEHTQAVLTKLAQWHAASAARVAIRGPYKPSLTTSFFTPDGRQMMIAIQNQTGSTFLKCAKSFKGIEEFYDSLIKTQETVIDDLYDAVEPEVGTFCVINHGDCWANNAMFQHDAFGKIKKTYMVDFQLPKYGSPAQDLYYFLLSSTKYELKVAKFDYFIRFYYNQLAEHLKKLNYPKPLPALKDLHIALYKRGLWGYTTVTGVMASVLLDPAENANLDNYVGEDNAGDSFRNQMFSNPRYRKHAELVLPWLYNRGAFKC